MEAIRAGFPVPVWSEALGEWLYWVRGDVESERLRAQGCVAPIYTLGELTVVVALHREDLKTIHALKKNFDGVLKTSTKAASTLESLVQ